MTTTIADEMVAAFQRAAWDRMMHEDGCAEGESIRAGIEAIAPMIRARALQEARLPGNALPARHLQLVSERRA